jgi:hypothetical protein
MVFLFLGLQFREFRLSFWCYLDSGFSGYSWDCFWVCGFVNFRFQGWGVSSLWVQSGSISIHTAISLQVSIGRGNLNHLYIVLPSHFQNWMKRILCWQNPSCLAQTCDKRMLFFVLIILYSLYLEYDRPLIPDASGQAG